MSWGSVSRSVLVYHCFALTHFLSHRAVALDLHFTMISPFCNGTEGSCGFPAGSSMDIAVNIIVEQINKQRYLADNSTLVVNIVDDHCEARIAQNAIVELLLSNKLSWPFGVIGSGCSGVTMRLSPLLFAASIPLVSHAATNAALSNRSKYPNFFRIFPPDGPSIRVWFQVFNSFGWNKFAMSWDIEYGEGLVDFAKSVKNSYGGQMVDVLDGRSVQIIRDREPITSQTLLEAIIASRVRGIMVMSYSPALCQLACQMVKFEVRGMYVAHVGWFEAGWWQKQRDIIDCSVQAMDRITEFWLSANPPAWGDPTSSITCAPGGYTVKEFADEYEKRRSFTDIEFRAESGAAADAICMMATLYNYMIEDGYEYTSLLNMNDSTYKAWSAKAQMVSFAGASGPVSFASDPEAYGSGDRIGKCEVYQKFANENQLLGVAILSLNVVEIHFLPGKQFAFDNVTEETPPPGLFKKCPDRHVYNHATDECKTCNQGRVYVDTAMKCECETGFFEVASGACETCPAGKHSSTPGTRSCSLCFEGQYSSGAARECSFCERGRFAAERGMSGCVACDDGPGFETVNVASKSQVDCVCPAGTYFHDSFSNGGEGSCRRCSDYLLCPGGFSPLLAEADTTVAVIAGYMVLEENEKLLVFQCAHSTACPGFRHLFLNTGLVDKSNMCQNHHKFQASCGSCDTGYYPVKQRCEACVTKEIHLVFFIIGVSIAWVLYYQSMFPPDPVHQACGILVAFTQALYLACQFAIPIPQAVLNRLRGFLDFVQFDFSLVGLSFDCGRNSSFLHVFVYKLCWPLLLLVGFHLLFFSSMVLRKLVSFIIKRDISSPVELIPQGWLLRRLVQKLDDATSRQVCFSQRLVWFWSVKWADVINAIIKTQNALFIVLTTTALTLFRFHEHPSGKYTVISFPFLIDQSPEWFTALPVSLLMLATYTIMYFAIIVRIVIVAPQRVSRDAVFHQRYRCLWAKFDPSSYWFSTVHLAYALFLNLVPVVTTNGRVQLLGQLIVNTLYILLVCHVRPWKYQLIHVSDLTAKVGLASFVLVSVGLIVALPLDDFKLGIISFVLLAMPFIVILSSILRFLWYNLVNKVQELAFRVEFAQRLNDILKIVGSLDTLELRAYAVKMLDNDVRCIDRALDVLQFTMIGLQSKYRSRWRSARVPFEIAVDGRLEGEMVARSLLASTDMRVEIRRLNKVLHDVLDEHQLHLNRTLSLTKGNKMTGQFNMPHFVQEIYRGLDKDIDGVLSRDELSAGLHDYLHSRGVTFSKDTLKRIFDFVDVDQSGSLTAIEFSQAIKDIPPPIIPSNGSYALTGGGSVKAAGDTSTSAPLNNNIETERGGKVLKEVSL